MRKGDKRDDNVLQHIRDRFDLSFLNDFLTHDDLNRLATPDEAESLLFFLAINQSFREKIARLIYILD